MDDKEYINKNFPLLQPCVDCEYWRYMNVSGSGYFYEYNSGGRKRKFKTANRPDVCCHYNLDTDMLRPDGAYRPLKGECDCFRPRDNHFIKMSKGKFVKWGI